MFASHMRYDVRELPTFVRFEAQSADGRMRLGSRVARKTIHLLRKRMLVFADAVANLS